MPTLVSPGVSVTIVDESFYVAATAPTVPLFFLATRADKLKPDGVTPAPGALENGVVRTITSLNASVDTYGVPFFRTDNSGAPLHGDCRNEYGLFALNQYLTIGNVAYVVRANVDLADADVVTFTPGTPQFVGVGNGPMTGVSVNQLTAQAETWSITCTSASGLTPGKSTPQVITNGFNFSASNATMTIDGVVITLNTNDADYAAIAAELTTKMQASALGATYSAAIDISNRLVITHASQINPVVITAVNGNAVAAGFLNSSGVAGTTFASIWSVTGFLSGAQGTATPGVPYNNGILSFLITNGLTPFQVGDTFTVVVTSTTTFNPLGANDAAKRVTIVTALQAQINSNMDVRSDYYEYNLILCPGYWEVVDELLNLNLAINEEAFVIADTPFNKTPEDTAIWSLTVARQRSQFVAYYYPHALASNLDGVDCFVAASGLALKTYAYSDDVSEVWFPPAGLRRGVQIGIENVGYITGTLGTATTFVPAPLNQGQRDVLYEFFKNINPIPFFPGRGIVIWGQKTSYSLTSALDRVNVMRLLIKMKREIRKAAMAYVFELNDRITRDSIKEMIDSYLNDILVRRGLYDFLVICDESNNTPVRIDRNELWVDILVKPAKAIEFIYIPIRVVSTGANLGG